MRKTTTRLALTLVASLCLFSTVFSQKEKDRVLNYIEQYKDIAISEMMRTGIPASITLAQGLLETGFGQSDLAQYANNHFGIKCKAGWTGATMLHDDDAKGECFRKYNSAEESYRDHSDFLTTRPIYKFLFNIDPSDYKGWAYGLKKAGYATSPTYAQRLIKYIEDNNLQEYTLIGLKQMAANNNSSIEQPSKDVPAIDATTVSYTSAPASLEKGIEPAAATEKLADNINKNKVAPYPTGKTFTINGAKVMYIEEGTSLFAVAAINSISYNRLLEFNELEKQDIVDKDQLIFLEKKQRKGVKDFHIVEANEDLHSISQLEGVQLNSLLEFNHLNKSSKLNVGQKIYLKASTPNNTKIAGSFEHESASSM